MDNNSKTDNSIITKENDQTTTNSLVDMVDIDKTTQVDVLAKNPEFSPIVISGIPYTHKQTLKKDYTRIDVVTVQTAKQLSKFWKLTVFLMSIPSLVLFQYNIQIYNILTIAYIKIL